MTTRIFFVRHGEVNNPNKIWYGRLPGFSLSQNGKIQIAKTAQLLAKKNISAIYSSPLLRTSETAKIIADTLNLPINYSDDLLEIESSMQGRTRDYVLANTINFNVYSSSENNITGETIKDVAERTREFIDKIIKNHSGKNIAAVTHGDSILIAKALIEKLPITIDSIRPKGYFKQGGTYIAKFNSQ